MFEVNVLNRYHQVTSAPWGFGGERSISGLRSHLDEEFQGVSWHQCLWEDEEGCRDHIGRKNMLTFFSAEKLEIIQEKNDLSWNCFPTLCLHPFFIPFHCTILQFSCNHYLYINGTIIQTLKKSNSLEIISILGQLPGYRTWSDQERRRRKRTPWVFLWCTQPQVPCPCSHLVGGHMIAQMGLQSSLALPGSAIVYSWPKRDLSSQSMRRLLYVVIKFIQLNSL